MANKRQEKVELKESKTDLRVYNVLSYIGILWLVGMFGSDKDDASVRFHVGQGILVSLIWLVVELFNSLIVANLFRTTYVVVGVTYTTVVSVFGGFVMAILNFIPLVFMIIGIINALNKKDEELPFIGKYSFYK